MSLMIKALRAAEQRQRERDAGAAGDAGDAGDGAADRTGSGPIGSDTGEPGGSGAEAAWVAQTAPGMAPSASGDGSPPLARLFSRRIGIPLGGIGLLAVGALVWMLWTAPAVNQMQQPLAAPSEPPAPVFALEPESVGSAEPAPPFQDRLSEPLALVADPGDPMAMSVDGVDGSAVPADVLVPLLVAGQPAGAMEPEGSLPADAVALSDLRADSAEAIAVALDPTAPTLEESVAAPPMSLPSESTQGSTVPEEALLAALEGWARAWASRDVTAYLDAYSARFEPAGNLERGQWIAQRRERVAAPSFIQVNVIAPSFESAEAGYRARFWQEYRSDRYSSSRAKQLTFIDENGRWRILREELIDGDPRGGS